ncbi:MAG: response regulator [Flavobacterium sp.]
MAKEIKNVKLDVTSAQGFKSQVLAQFKPIKYEGEILVCTALQDITEQLKDKINLNESEKKFRLVFEKSLAPSIIADDQGNYLDANSAASKLFGYSVAALKKMNVVDIITESRSKSQLMYEDYLKKGRDIGEFDFISKDGTHKTVVYHAVRIKPDFNLSIMTNTTEQKRISQELVKEKMRAEEAMNYKQQFLSNMSHEIRTPLNSIIGFTNVLLKTNFDDTQKEYLEAIQTSGHFLNVLINDILDVSKVDAGKMTFAKEPFELRTSIQSMIKTFELDLLQKNLLFELEFQENIPAIVLGDLVRLNQILTNLIGNAIKFTHKGKVALTVRLADEHKETLSLEFAVSDTGIGIASHKISSVFQLFEQAEKNTFSKFGGTGLGLAIVKKMVEAQNGSISVESKIGVGSTFKFVLPLHKSGQQTIRKAAEIKPIKHDGDVNILVVEDGTINQLLIKVILKQFGLKCELASNGKMAIEKLQNTHFDLILMDIQMPVMNGFEATDYIRNTMKSNIPIIALTADVTSADFQKCMQMGMNDYVSKPIDENQLYAKMLQFVARS